MNDELLFARLESHDGPAPLDGAFQERLFATLQGEMRRGRSRRPSLLLVAAMVAVLTLTAALAVGSGLIKLPWLDPSLIPQPSAEGSASPGPSHTLPGAGSWVAAGKIDYRFGHTATLLLDGRVLVAGGRSGDTILASAELYDPIGQTWTATGNMTEVRHGHTATLLPDGRVLVSGGSARSSTSQVSLASAEIYDPATGTWTATGSLNTSRRGHTATLLPDGRVLVAGGESGDDTSGLAIAELWDPASGSWTATGSMGASRYGHSATLLLDGTVLVVGGGGAAELYEPATGSWSDTARISPRWSHTATLLPDGRVLVVGGNSELYDPATGSWAATGNMITSRVEHAAALLRDGTVLVIGGVTFVDGFERSLADAELYDPATGSWTAIRAAPIRGHYRATATLLADGSVLVVGGDHRRVQGQGAELYVPGDGP